MNFINIVDNSSSISNNIFINSTLNIIYHPIDKKEKTTPFLLWPVKDDQSEYYNCIKFLHIKQQNNNVEIKPLPCEKFIQYQVLENSDLIYTFSKDRLFIYKLNSNSSWSLISSSKSNDVIQFTNKTIHHYYSHSSETNNLISTVSTGNQQLISIFKNIVSSGGEMTIDIITFNEINEFSNLQIIDIKWSFCGLILSICTLKEIILLKWKSYDDIGSKGYQLIRYSPKHSDNNDIIKFNWVNNNNFTITTYPSIQFSNNINNNNTPTLKLPSTIKPSIQLFDKETDKEEGEQEEITTTKEIDEILFIKPQSKLNSPIQSLFMINHENISTTKTTTTITTTTTKPLVQPIENDSTIIIPIDNKQKQQPIGPFLILFKLINNNNEITSINKLLLNNEHMTIPNIVIYSHGVICISSTYSKYIEMVKIKSDILIHHKSVSLDLHYSQYKFKGLSFIQLDNNQTFKLYGLAGESLNKKGIGLSFKTTTDWKISLFNSNETIDLISNTRQQQIPVTTPTVPIPPTSPSIDSFLNFQQILLSKLTNIENTLNNHSTRLTNIENSIDKITKILEEER